MKATKIVAVLAVAGLALAACGGDDDDDDAASDTTAAGATATTAAGGTETTAAARSRHHGSSRRDRRPRQRHWICPAKEPLEHGRPSAWSPTSARSTTRASTSRRGRACSRRRRIWAPTSSSSRRGPQGLRRTTSDLRRDSYDVIVTVGFALGEATAEAAKKFPNIKFIGVDQFQA